jgi:hypothetical protein
VIAALALLAAVETRLAACVTGASAVDDILCIVSVKSILKIVVRSSCRLML